MVTARDRLGEEVRSGEGVAKLNPGRVLIFPLLFLCSFHILQKVELWWLGLEVDLVVGPETMRRAEKLSQGRAMAISEGRGLIELWTARGAAEGVEPRSGSFELLAMVIGQE